MRDWESFAKLAVPNSDIMSLREEARKDFEKYGVYPDSVHRVQECTLFMGWYRDKKVLFATGRGEIYEMLSGEEVEAGDVKVKICSLILDNCKVIRKYFPFTSPVSYRGKDISMGLGDRLGLASPAHIRLIKGRNVFPVLAQQSIRELNLTDRTYEDVLQAASWAVFQEGYTDGFGADGDHLKTPEEVKMALDAGFTMITLDCSEYIDNDAALLSDEEAEQKYYGIDETDRKILEEKYLNRTFLIDNEKTIHFSAVVLRKIALIYLKAIKFTVGIYHDIIKASGKDIDFEMSIDETLTPTTPEAHFFVASELVSNGVEIRNLAPRFCGEFQKGIDYRGDINRFEEEFAVHVSIARHFGYKISIHSGSDKFSVFPIIGTKTSGRFHLKVAGTNWLEAVRVIAAKNPGLFRRMYLCAVENLNEAKKYYHIFTEQTMAPNIDNIPDIKLPEIMDIETSRQIMHITYGILLKAKDHNGKFIFRDEIYETLEKYESIYYAYLEKHIGKHLEALGIEI